MTPDWNRTQMLKNKLNGKIIKTSGWSSCQVIKSDRPVKRCAIRLDPCTTRKRSEEWAMHHSTSRRRAEATVPSMSTTGFCAKGCGKNITLLPCKLTKIILGQFFHIMCIMMETASMPLCWEPEGPRDVCKGKDLWWQGLCSIWARRIAREGDKAKKGLGSFCISPWNAAILLGATWCHRWQI